MYQIFIYTSRNTSRRYAKDFKTLSIARKEAQFLALQECHQFQTGDFHDRPINQAKISIEKIEYPVTSFELWEYIVGHDSKPLKTEWSA